MKSPRIAILTKSFWPLSGPTEQFVADLADSFSEKGNEVTVVTAAWQKEWPAECSFREFRLVRAPRPAPGPWGTFRFQRPMLRILERLKPDAVLMFGTGSDVGPIKKLLGDDVRCVVRTDHRHLHQRGRGAKKPLNLEPADALICDSNQTRIEMVARKFFLPSRVETIVDGVRYPHDHQRSLFRQANARTALGDAHPIFRIEPAQPLVVTAAPIDGDGGMHDLIGAWKIVLESYPKSKLWLLGDGPRGRKVWDQISSLNMVYSAIMPGYFDEYSVVYQAADLYVHPMRQIVNCRGLLEAIANELCPVVTQGSVDPLPNLDKSGSPQVMAIRKDVSGIVTPAGNIAALGEAITMALGNSDLRARLGRSAAQEFRGGIDIELVASRFLDCLFPPSRTFSQTGVDSSEAQQR